MKKVISLVCALAIVFCFASCGSEKEKGPGVYISIFDSEKAVLASKFVALNDYDKNGEYTIEEALRAAHAKYAPGKENDFECADTEYGRSLVKLWGDDSMAYGYYINNNASWSMADPISENDYICAFVYQDSATWSDVYAWFDSYTAEGSEVKLTLSAYTSYSADGLPIKETIADAKILIDGEASEFTTDKSGSVTISGLKKGSHVITAVSDTYTLSGAVCAFEAK